MIEVTDEMLRGGLAYWEANKRSATMPQLADGMFRAMRALEPVPEPLKFGRQTAYRPEFAGEAQFAPDPRGRLFSDTVAARKAVDPEFREALVEDRRLDALQALVLVLAARSPGYPPGDATLTRLIAELENAR